MICKNYLDTYYKTNGKKDVKLKLLPKPILKKSIINWIKIHRGAYVGDLHDFLIFNYRTKNKVVSVDKITNCLQELKRERIIRVHKFSYVHRYAILSCINKKRRI